MLYRTGEYKLEQNSKWSYHTFFPLTLIDNKNIEIDDELYVYLIKTHRLLGELYGMIKYMPNIDLWYDLLIKYEATLSCQLSGKNFSFSDLWNISSRTFPYINKVITFVEILKESKGLVDNNHISLDFIKEIHKKLVHNESPKQAGIFRKEQLFINSKISTNYFPYFNPPNPDDMRTALCDFEKYLDYDCPYDTLIQAALIYYQFITIQPFISGNHRMGKLIINMFLVQKKLLPLPILAFSYFFNKNDLEYRDIILSTRNNGGYLDWIKFFIKAITVDTEHTINLFNSLHNLYTEDYEKIQAMDKRIKLELEIYKYLFKIPILETRYITNDFNISYNTAAKSIQNLNNIGILCQMKHQERYRKFIYKRLLAIFD